MRTALGLALVSPMLWGMASAGAFQQEDFTVPLDFSWTVNTYYSKGMPPIDRPWKADDFRRAEEVLKRIVREHSVHRLPRYADKFSGRVFDRLISDEHLDPIRDESLSLERRLATATNLLGWLRRLLPIYVKPEKTARQLLDNERVEIQAYRLKLSRYVMDIAEARVREVAGDDAARIQGQRIRDRLVRAMGRNAFAAIKLMKPENGFRTASVRRMADYCAEQLPPMMAHLSVELQAEMRRRLTAIRDSRKQEELRRRLTRILEKLG
ncbi:MAG: hypothetical protein ACE5EX_03365 [Phycisphaerae bacterium]